MAKKSFDLKALARKLGVAESTLRARKARGQRLDAPRQVRTTAAQQKAIVRAKGTNEQIAARFGVSVSTVKRLRRVLRGGARKAARKKK